MIEEFTRAWFKNMHEVRAKFEADHPEDYKAVVRAVVEVLAEGREYDCPDAERIHEIDDSEYQGTLVYVIPEKSCQPDRYWYCRISYGSCSGCDTLEGIRDYREGTPDEDQVNQYMQLALHVVQALREMDAESA